MKIRRVFLLILLFILPLNVLGQEIISEAVVSAGTTPVQAIDNLISYDLSRDTLARDMRLKDIVSKVPLLSFNLSSQALQFDGSDNICILVNGMKSLIITPSNFSYVSELLKGYQFYAIEVDTSPTGIYKDYAAVINFKSDELWRNLFVGTLDAHGSTDRSAGAGAAATGQVGRVIASASYGYRYNNPRPTYINAAGFSLEGGALLYESSDTLRSVSPYSHTVKADASISLSGKDMLFFSLNNSMSEISTGIRSYALIGGNSLLSGSRNDSFSNHTRGSLAWQHDFRKDGSRLLTAQYSLQDYRDNRRYTYNSSDLWLNSLQNLCSLDYQYVINPSNTVSLSSRYTSRQYDNAESGNSILAHAENILGFDATGSMRLGPVMLHGNVVYEYGKENAVWQAGTSCLDSKGSILNYSLRANWFISAGRMLMASMSKQVFRPDISFRSPFADESMVGAVSVGNPDLTYDHTYHAILMYRYFRGTKFSYNAMASFVANPDGIFPTTSVMEDGRVLHTYRNGLTRNKLFLSTDVGFAPSDKLRFDLSYRLGFFENKAKGIHARYIEHFAHVSSDWRPSGRLWIRSQLMLRNPQEADVLYSDTVRPHYRLEGMFNVSYLLGDNWSIDFIVSDPWCSYRQVVSDYISGGMNMNSVLSQPARSFSLIVRYKIGRFSGMVARNSRAYSDTDRSKQ